MAKPLAELLRPETPDQLVGQKHLLAEGKPLARLLEAKETASLIFYGPPGTGKTTVAKMMAKRSGKRFFLLNGTDTKTSELQQVMEESRSILGTGGILLYLDEIQYLNKKQQQVILEYVEKGNVTLVAATTENPYFYVYPAVLSRCIVFEFKPVAPKELLPALYRGVEFLSKREEETATIAEETLLYLASCAGGDVRKSLNFLEMLWYMTPSEDKIRHLTLESAKEVCISANARYDKDGDAHYDLLSALQKSIRGSDPDAAVFSLAKLLEAGDLLSPCRRLLVIASEDIGLAYPAASQIVKSLVDSATQLGLPEARISLAHAAILLATAPKSNTAITAIDRATIDIRRGKGQQIPAFLRDAHYAGAEKLDHGVGYVYPHGQKNNYVPISYLPSDLTQTKYYRFGDNKTEQAAAAYWEMVKGEANK
ncbi:MAG: replication-associated recombination protein A [Oscillospiraceae bacterium]|nr:replication-associated recombination protein A [Oscillospiraceae bacterium]